MNIPFVEGKLNVLRNIEEFPWESLILNTQKYGQSIYLVFGNVLPVDLRTVHVLLKRMKIKSTIKIRRGFTYYALLEIIQSLKNYYDMVIVFHDPVSYSDLKKEEKFVLLNSLLISLTKYAEDFDSIAIFVHDGEFNYRGPYNRIDMEFIGIGWKIRSNSSEIFIYHDPRQTSLEYFMEV